MSATLRLARRPRPLATVDQLAAVLRLPALYELAALVPAEQPVGRRQHFPPYLLLFYGVAARVFRSGVRVQTELAHPATWQTLRQVITAMAESVGEAWRPAPARPPTWEHFRWARDRYFTDPDLQQELTDAFIVTAVAQAQDQGLLRADGGGSLSHPAPTRTVYGDGTVVRPLYRPPAARRERDETTGETRVVYLDASTGEVIDAPRRRFDPDAAEFHGHAGPVHGANFVALYARDAAPGSRVVLAVDRTDRPGREADTAVALIERLRAVAGAGMQAVVYDGALRGVHLERLMTRSGLVVINKVPARPLSAAEKAAAGDEKALRWYPLGTWEHDTATGTCRHQLSAVDGAVCETGLDAAGAPIVLDRLVRRQVKRPQRAGGGYHFSVAFEVACPNGAFTAWITPHGEPGDPDARRAEHVRIIAEGEDTFTRLYGLRNDAESWNATFKRTLLVDRAASKGWRRQLLDVMCAALLNNARSAHQHTLRAAEAA